MKTALREARPDEAAALTQLALRSKRTWGYNDAFMQSIETEMVVHEEDIRDGYAVVAERNRTIAGYALLLRKDDVARICDMFVEPQFLRQGIGGALLADLLKTARAWGVSSAELVSDPHAVGFYRRAGFRTKGYYDSPHVPGRRLPIMILALR